MLRRSSLFLLALGFVLAVEKKDEPAPDRPLAFRGARIHTAAGAPIDNGVLVIHRGKIVAVGAADRVEVPKNAVVRDVSGLVIIPGLVDTHSHVGIWSK